MLPTKMFTLLTPFIFGSILRGVAKIIQTILEILWALLQGNKSSLRSIIVQSYLNFQHRYHKIHTSLDG